VLPDVLKQSLASSQRVSKRVKILACAGIILTHAIGAAAIGLSPIPFSDAALLVPLQTEMFASLAAIWGLYVWRYPKVVLFYASFQTLTAMGGLGLANLLKLIPGFGTWAGMAIDAAVASCLTAALGVGYSAAFNAVATKWPQLGNLQSDQIMEVMRPYTQPEYIASLVTKFREGYSGGGIQRSSIEGLLTDVLNEKKIK